MHAIHDEPEYDLPCIDLQDSSSELSVADMNTSCRSLSSLSGSTHGDDLPPRKPRRCTISFCDKVQVREYVVARDDEESDFDPTMSSSCRKPKKSAQRATRRRSSLTKKQQGR